MQLDGPGCLTTSGVLVAGMSDRLCLRYADLGLKA